MPRDYSAYRSYGEEAEGEKASGGLLAGIRRVLKAALNFGAPRTPTPAIVSKRNHDGFSTLGGKSEPASAANTNLNDNAQCTH